MLKRYRSLYAHKGRSDKSRHGLRTRLGAENLEPRIVLDSTVVFNELMYNPSDDEAETAEWIELYNQLAVDMDISEWELDGGVDYTFPDGTIVPGRGFLLVAATPDEVQAPENVEVVGPYSGMLSNGGEEIRLFNNDGRLMNTIDYNDGGKWPTAPDGSGVTLAKRKELSASEDFTNWTSSGVVGGTPGEPNFDVIDLGGGGEIELTNLVPNGGPVTVHVPADDSLGRTWIDPDFDDGTWHTGNAGVGYDTETTYDSHIGVDVEDMMQGINTSIYIRMEFDLSVDPADMQSFFLEMQYDDGFIAYLNGTEIVKTPGIFGEIGWNSRTIVSHPDSEAVKYVDFDMTSHKDLLNVGSNLLAIHGVNQTVSDPDFLISPRFGYVPMEVVVTPTDSTIPLAFTEVSPLEGNKFVEIANFGAEAIDLDGMVLRASGLEGGDYVFPVQSLAAGGRLVLTEADLGLPMVDDERFFLYTADQSEVIDARPITRRLRGLSPDGQWLYPDVPTPNAENSFDLVDQIVINEIMYHHQPQPRTANTAYAESNEEWIELYNRGDTPVDLTGWEIRDAVRFSFAEGTMIGPGEYLVIARDPVALGEKFPDIDIVGPFDGALGNSEDRILLVDGNANPADEVKYYESGQWDETADGGGSSLELRDPFADNSIGTAWAASDESSNSDWNSYTASKVSDEPLTVGTTFDEFIIGMLDSSEVLLDNISLRQGNSEVISGGDFEDTPIGSVPSRWRFLGNHRGTVIADPDDPSNRVLHLNAIGAQQHVHDHMEVDFAGGLRIQDGQTYTVSFDAKWMSGSRQLNSRLYFSRASNTIILDAPQSNGTPGAQNSQFVDNIGPTYTNFGHAPIMPDANQPVTVSVAASDPQGVESMELYYKLDRETFTSVPMSLSAGGVYSASIPGQLAGQVVQFYVQGTDSLGAVSTFPAAGPESRALYEVDDGQGPTRPIETFRIVLLSADNSELFLNINKMSNNYVPGTLIVGDHTVFYDVDVRQIGSQFIRPNSGYKVKLGADNRYLGVHKSVRFDIELLDEIIYKQMMNRAGGSEASMYDDISYMIAPQHNGRRVLLNLARYEAIYLEEQFQNGNGGTKFELDDVTVPANKNADGYKTGSGAQAQDMRYHGTDPEAYRGQLLIKNNRALDDFEAIAEFVRVINLNGTALDNAIDDVMDVDLWMRHYATQSFLGNWDTYGFRRPKNLRLYTRPSDGKIIPLYWDADRGNLTDALIYNGPDSRLDEIRNIPRNERLFWGHMLDLVDRGFNGDYTAYWTDHYNEFVAGANVGDSMADRQNQITNRANQARNQALATIPMVNFAITTNGGNPMTVDETNVTLRGDGWIDVREVRFLDSDIPLKVKWTDNNSWEINVPLQLGENDITLEAFDFRDNRTGVSNITVTTTATQPAVRDQLRITEIHYNPLGEDDTEFIELMHAGPEGSSPISLAGVRFTDGIDFEFPVETSLEAGERVVVVSHLVAFEDAYGRGINVAGQYTGALNNAGEGITLVDDIDAVIHSFDYNDNWFPESDGIGYSLTIADPMQELRLWDSADGWRLSEDIGGSPGIPDDGLLPNSIVINEISNNDTAATGNWLEIHNRTDRPIDIGNWYLSDDEVDPMKYQFAADTTIVQGGYMVLDEMDSFGNAAAAGVNSSFALSELGGVVWLNAADENGDLLPYQFRRSYAAAEPDATQGLVQTSDGLKFATLTADTRASANLGPVIGPIVINEIMYNPANEDAEFIEIHNITGDDITLNDGVGQAWQLVNGINYTFPAGEVLPAGGFAVLVQGEDGGNATQTATDFRDANNVPPEVAIYVYEPTANGSLDNAGEELLLARPSESVAGLINVDEIDYEDSFPWPDDPDGTGPSLSKLTPNPFGNEPSNWGTGSIGGTPGRENVLVDVTPPTKPTNFVARAISPSEVVMAWTASVDAESGISHYVIYRNNEPFATSPFPFFVDEDVEFQVEPISYQVSAVNRDDLASNGRSNTVIIGTEVFTFQEGKDGYSGGSDAEIRETEPDTNLAAETTVEAGGESGGGERTALFRWDNIAIPEGRALLDAWFTINVTQNLLMFNTDANPFEVSHVLRDWSEDQVTWNQFRDNQSWQSSGAKGIDDRGIVLGKVDARETGSIVIISAGPNLIQLDDDGVAVVRGWIEDPSTNNGILVASNVAIDRSIVLNSKEAESVEERPALNLLLAPFVAPVVPGDFTLDDEVTTIDLNILCGAIQSGATHSVYDLDGSGAADLDDVGFLLNSLGTASGDSDLNGRIDSADLNAVGVNWLQVGDHLGWGDGDFTCDGRVDAADLNEIGTNWLFGAAAAAQARVPRAPLAAVAPVGSRVADLAIVDVMFSAGNEKSDREQSVVTNELMYDRGVDFENHVRWRSETSRRSEGFTHRSEPSADSLQQFVDEVFEGFDVL